MSMHQFIWNGVLVENNTALILPCASNSDSGKVYQTKTDTCTISDVYDIRIDTNDNNCEKLFFETNYDFRI